MDRGDRDARNRKSPINFPFLVTPPRHLLFTGKGGVGKTSIAAASAVELAEGGRRVLLVSTDPASNLGAVLETPLGAEPTPVRGMRGLFALKHRPRAGGARLSRADGRPPPWGAAAGGGRPAGRASFRGVHGGGGRSVRRGQSRGDGERTLQAGNEGMGTGEEISGVSNPLDGLIDEIRISTVVRPDAWLKATYRNLSTPTSFLYSGAAEQEGGGGPTPPCRRPIVMTIFT